MGTHQREITPLLRLKNVDMIQDFTIGDGLHLLDHGISKKILIGLMEGKLNNVDAKWSERQIKLVSMLFESIKPPAEIRAQRPIRSLETIGKWKAVEYRTFGLYLGMLVLRNNVKDYIYKHFLLYFCALNTISSKHHLKRLLPIAEWCYNLFVERFKIIYGAQHFTSNLHNMIHLMDDVKRFGAINTFSTYPFEGVVFKIRRLLRFGNLPLSQVARRIIELESLDVDVTEPPNVASFTLGNFLSKTLWDLDKMLPMKYNLYSKVEFPKFVILCDRDEDRWILTKNNEIFEVLYLVAHDMQYLLYGHTIEDSDNYFNLPFQSSQLLIFSSLNFKKGVPVLLNVNMIKCKLFKIKRDENLAIFNEEDDSDTEKLNEYVFMPLHYL